MSVESQTRTRDRDGYSEDRGGGWLLFAGVMLLIIGTMNFIGGIAAIDDANFYVANAHYVCGALHPGGWIIRIPGAVQVLAGLGIFARNQFARWLGVGFASLNMLAQ